MKGKDTFTAAEIADLRELIRLRVKAHTKSEQKRIRDKMRKIGFYGGDDWGIRDYQETDLDRLISCGQIKIQG